MAKKVVLIFITVFISIILGAHLITRARKVTLPITTIGTYASWSTKQDMVSHLTDRADTVILGDSTVYGGIKPEELNPHVYNFALDANTPLEGYYFLRYMIAQNKHPKNIVLSYLSYSYLGKTYWDYVLGFNLPFISRKDAKEILDIDQNTSQQAIAPYGNNFQKKQQGGTVHIPYYYDIAAGPLNHLNLDFNAYISSLTLYDHVFHDLYLSRGWGGTNILGTDTNKIWCVDKPPPLATPIVPFYLKQLVDLANEHNINVYLLGGPIPESCVNLGYSTAVDVASGIDISKLKLSGVYPKTPIPDKFMVNATHANRTGSSYFTKQIKPFFDGIE